MEEYYIDTVRGTCVHSATVYITLETEDTEENCQKKKDN